ncbi:MAG: hypothetical protein KGJ23_12160 [Euryarchaeota archaeon]|nr:hypothetical protein [Euryarchaeota archaeon]MDE1837350.1 hypothetical protein [Euryarchaeota archaeon]MDE1880918.1 hypothetical protein [Euryarchaeota archaeon]MDE2045628.1 hypothetical protein [Thermoplasmata archaeon]
MAQNESAGLMGPSTAAQSRALCSLARIGSTRPAALRPAPLVGGREPIRATDVPGRGHINGGWTRWPSLMSAAMLGRPAPRPRRPAACRSAAALSLLVLLLLSSGGGIGAPTPTVRAPTAHPSVSSRSPSVPFAAPTWVQHVTRVSPPPLEYSGVTYDPVDGYVVLFGGCKALVANNCVAPANDTWRYQGGVWTNLSEKLPAPSPRWGAGFTWDTSDGYGLLFGGAGTAGSYADTWTFLGGKWTNVTATAGTPPTGRSEFALFNDTVDGYAVLCCGGSNVGNLGDTWEFHGGTWAPLSATVPVRCCVQGAMDTAGGHGVIFGGGNRGALADSWFFSGGSWTSGPTGPTGVCCAGLAYDPVYRYDLLFGGGSNSGPVATTWTLSGSTWTPQSPSASPSARAEVAETFDARDGYLMLYGGTPSISGPIDNDTWLWTAPNPLLLNSLTATPDPVDVTGTTWINVSASGGSPSYSYAYAGLPPGCTSRNSASLSCAPSVAGTYSVSVWVNDTVGNSVQGALQLSVDPLPSIGSFSASPAPGEVSVPANLTVAVSGGSPPFRYTYTGLPAGCASSNAFSLPCTPTAPGTFSVGVTAADAQGKVAVGSLTWSVDPLPSIVAFIATPSPQDLGLVVNLTTTTSGGTGPMHYTYLGLPAGCSPRNSASLTCAPVATGTFAVQVNATDIFARSAYGFLNLTVGPDLSMTAFSASPVVVDVGATVVFRESTSGGVAPISYTYGGLPPGCSSRNLSTDPCTPSASGNFTVFGNATDLRGDPSSSSLLLTVHRALEIGAFRPLRLPLDQGDVLGLLVSTYGGTAPFSFAYSGLPPGCLSSNASTLSCTPSTYGSFNVTVSATDPGGGAASATVSFSIAAPLKVVSFGPTPSTVVLGNTVQFALETLGGSTPLRISYQGLPQGCSSANSSFVICTPTASGSTTVSVAVIDMAGHSVETNATLVVQPIPPAPASNVATQEVGLPLWAWALLVAVAVTMLLVGFLLGRRRREGNASGAPPASSLPATAGSRPSAPPGSEGTTWASVPQEVPVEPGPPPAPPSG